jgi:hypothetical protein
VKGQRTSEAALLDLMRRCHDGVLGVAEVEKRKAPEELFGHDHVLMSREVPYTALFLPSAIGDINRFPYSKKFSGKCVQSIPLRVTFSELSRIDSPLSDLAENRRSSLNRKATGP